MLISLIHERLAMKALVSECPSAVNGVEPAVWYVEIKNAPEGAYLLYRWRSGRDSNPRPPA